MWGRKADAVVDAAQADLAQLIHWLELERRAAKQVERAVLPGQSAARAAFNRHRRVALQQQASVAVAERPAQPVQVASDGAVNSSIPQRRPHGRTFPDSNPRRWQSCSRAPSLIPV